MASTNPLKIQDPEKLAHAELFSSPSSPRSSDTHPPTEEADNNIQPSRMPGIQHLFFCCVLLALLTFTFASASSNAARNTVSLQERLRFQELLDSVEPAALHDVLHEHMKDKYQHGVFQEDRTALEAVHQSNAEVAQSLVELAKRQSSNSTTPATVQSSSTTSTLETSKSSVIQSTPASTSQAETQASTTAQQSSQADTTTPHTTAVVASTSTPTVASTPATTEASSSTEGPASTTQASSGSSVTSSSLVQSSSASGNTISSITPTGSRTQSVVYTTLVNGAATTVTSVTVVPADQADNTGSAGSTKTTGGASLQTNGANALNLGLTGVLGAIGVAVAGAL